MQFDEVLTTWKDFFEREQIDYALAGGQAIAAWGHERSTHDVDFVVRGHDHPRIIRFAESLGYETTYVSDGYSNHHHPQHAFGHIDFMYVYGSTADSVLSGSVPRDRLGVRLPVVRPEHLVAMKVRAMKNSPMRVLIDAPDIAFLLTLAELDHERVREYFAQHGLLKIYDELEKERRRN
jgi:hypothetical protein